MNPYCEPRITLTESERTFFAQIMGVSDYGQLPEEITLLQAGQIRDQIQGFMDAGTGPEGHDWQTIMKGLESRMIEADRHPNSKKGLPDVTEHAIAAMRELVAYRMRSVRAQHYHPLNAEGFAFFMEGEGPRRAVTMTIDREVDTPSLRSLMTNMLGPTAFFNCHHAEGKTVCHWVDPIKEKV